MNIFVVNNLLAALDWYLGLLTAMIAICVIFSVVALLIPKRLNKSEETEIQPETFGEVPELVVMDEPETVDAVKDAVEEEPVPTVKQVLGDFADDIPEEETNVETYGTEQNEPTYGGSGPVLTIEQIIDEAEKNDKISSFGQNLKTQNSNKKKNKIQ